MVNKYLYRYVIIKYKNEIIYVFFKYSFMVIIWYFIGIIVCVVVFWLKDKLFIYYNVKIYCMISDFLFICNCSLLVKKRRF